MQIDDETLMALADGELDPGRAEAVRRAVAADPELQARLRRFEETRRLLAGLRGQGGGAGTGRGSGTGTGTEDPLAAMIRAAAAKAPPAAAPQPANLNRRPWMAAAASVAVVAIGLGWWQWPEHAPTGLAEAELAALDNMASGQVQPLADGGELAMIASFRAEGGALCREYETVRGEAQRIVLACRGTAGWQERFAATATGAGADYRPASGETSIDAALAAIGAGAPMTPEEEAQALRE
ncbi:hypothetical protein [Paracoccus simplex]|uniref:Anti-sigma factor n=1 Tax=Paracoccus simplex TaxID=2086346 RepID=A0ABV7RYL2_9RHOB